jgi:hypothetical protein
MVNGTDQRSGLRVLFDDVKGVALPLLVSGGGLLGLVAFVGGALTWARFSTANLPADQAVSAMSEGELVATGAVSLTSFALLGLLAVLVNYLINNDGNATQGIGYGLLVLVLAESVVVLWVAHDDVTQTVKAGLFLAAATGLSIYVIRQFLRPGDTQVPAYLACGTATVVIAFGTGLSTHEWWVGVMLPVAGALAFGCLRVADRTRRFAWFGVAVFFSVPVFGALFEVLRALDEPQLEPIALIRKGDGPGEGLQGIYVTENDDRVYLATVARERCGATALLPDSGRMFWVPRDDVLTYAVGPFQNVDRASRTAPAMLRDLLAMRLDAVKADAEPDAHIEAARSLTLAPAIRSQFKIDQLTPSRARPGDRVVLIGSGFGTLRGTVTVGGEPATFVRWRHGGADDGRDKIVFRVPPDARTGQVLVGCRTAPQPPVLQIRGEE